MALCSRLLLRYKFTGRMDSSRSRKTRGCHNNSGIRISDYCCLMCFSTAALVHVPECDDDIRVVHFHYCIHNKKFDLNGTCTSFA